MRDACNVNNKRKEFRTNRRLSATVPVRLALKYYGVWGISYQQTGDWITKGRTDLTIIRITI
jgi:hypothetical protein